MNALIAQQLAAADLSRIRCKTLAQTIARALEAEPLLRAEVDGASVTVRVIGEPQVMRVTISEAA